MQTERLHGDAIIGMSGYDDYDHELASVVALGNGDVPVIPLPRHHGLTEQDCRAEQHCRADEDGGARRAGAYRECADRRVQPLRDVTGRSDGDVRRDVLRALLLDSLVPLSVDAEVSDGVVTLTGAVGSERERKDAIYLAGCVPGVIGVLDELAYLPRPRADDDEATREAVMAALACTSIADIADLTVSTAGWGTVILSGAVQSRGDHDLAIATALSVANVEVVDDCMQVES
jgi:osmotically-inducible protein OsmY